MSDREKKQIDRQLRIFVSRHFDKPSNCRDLEQIQFYVKELSEKISDYKSRFNYVPEYAYTLLSDYNASQNKIIFHNFKRLYC